jgi:hypothetical protein
MSGPAEIAANGVVGPLLPEGAVHLLSAHEVDRAYGMTLVAVCGELVGTASPAGALSCPPECECDHRYCPECVHMAIRWSAQPVAGKCPPMADRAPREST